MTHGDLTVDGLRRVDGGHEYTLSRPITTNELVTAVEVFPRHEAALREVIDSMEWDFSGHETSRHIVVAGLTHGARPRVEAAILELLTVVSPDSETAIRASLDALPMDL